MRAGRGVGLASAAGSATVKKILDLSMESVSSLSAGQKGTVTLLDRSVKCGIFVYGAVCRQFLVVTQLVCCLFDFSVCWFVLVINCQGYMTLSKHITSDFHSYLIEPKYHSYIKLAL